MSSGGLPKRTAALVVGAGPVGLTTAIELARYGVAVRIIDKLRARSDKSKALVMWPRTLELMQRSGVSDALIAAGLTCTGAHIFAAGHQLGEILFDRLQSAYPYTLLITQDRTERVLEEYLTSLGVTVERGIELLTFADDGKEVIGTSRHPDGMIERLEADWLVACDGAHSPIRHALGMPFDGTTVATEFLLADVHLGGITPVSHTEISMFAHTSGLLQFFPIGNDRFRLIADLGVAGLVKRPDPTLLDVQRIVDERGPGGVVARDPIWLSTFRINERQVKNYRSGRVFLAGDAAHVHSPAGGQGMNTGMQDGFNLAWKLAMVVAGSGAVELLSTYDEERRPVAREMIANTSKLSALMTLRNPVLQSARNHVASFLLGVPAVRLALAEKLSEIAIGYPNSSLSEADFAPNGGPPAGARAPCRTGDTTAGISSAALYTLFAQQTETAQQFVDAHRALVEAAIRPPFVADGMWLVRPDGYVGAVARSDDWDALAAYLERVACGETGKRL